MNASHNENRLIILSIENILSLLILFSLTTTSDELQVERITIFIHI